MPLPGVQRKQMQKLEGDGELKNKFSRARKRQDRLLAQRWSKVWGKKRKVRVPQKRREV